MNAVPPPPLPQRSGTPPEWDDLQFLVSDPLAPTRACNEPGHPVALTDPWDVDDGASTAGAGEVVNPKRLRLARGSVPGKGVEPLTHPGFGHSRRHYLLAAEAQRWSARRSFVSVVDAPDRDQFPRLDAIHPFARRLAKVGTRELSLVDPARPALTGTPPPAEKTRQQVRAMADAAGGACLSVHVATSLKTRDCRGRRGRPYSKTCCGKGAGCTWPYGVSALNIGSGDTTGRNSRAAPHEVLAPHPPNLIGLAAPSIMHVAQQRRRDQDSPLRVLFVCTANICRSPFMELLARHLTGPQAAIQFSSAGTHGFVHCPMDQVMAQTLSLRGIDGPGAFMSRPLTGELIDKSDLVLTAETAHRSFILEDHPANFRKVFTLGQFVEAVRALPSALHGRPLLEEVGQHRGTADPRLNVTDPYRRGLEAAVATADDIDRLLRVALTALVGPNNHPSQ